MNSIKCINDIVIIDGLTRSGKFLLGKLVSSIDGLEYLNLCSELDRTIQKNKTGILRDIDASRNLVVAMNESIYNMAIGRNINMRYNDGSSIVNSFEKELYINRQNQDVIGNDAIKQLIEQKRSSVFILHQSLGSIDLIKKSISNLKIINIRRHPLELVYSWIKRGWGRRAVDDPLSFDVLCYHKNGVVPYYASGWADEYLDTSNEYDRVVKSVVHITEEESRVIKSKQHDICCIYYDNLIGSPDREIGKICAFLNRSPHESMSTTIERERRDIDFKAQRTMKMNYINSVIGEKLFFEKLLDLSNQYEQNIKNGNV